MLPRQKTACCGRVTQTRKTQTVQKALQVQKHEKAGIYFKF